MRKTKKTDVVGTFLGSDASVEGTLEFNGTIQLDGKVKGKISSSGGTVIIGEKAVIDADIAVGVAIIKGEVNGTISASGRITLKPPAKVVGDIRAPEISIEENVIFDGNCTMKSRAVSTGKTTDVPPKLFPTSN
jgi:cytoskeletal protein CcmA (bactofilin family)